MTVAIQVWQKTRRRWALARFADRPESGFEREALELLERQRQEQIDPSADQQERIPERRSLGGFVALDLGGIQHAPMGQHGLAGEDRARFLGPIAYGDDEIPRLALQAVHGAGSAAPPPDVA